jgi:hypothetical protein
VAFYVIILVDKRGRLIMTAKEIQTAKDLLHKKYYGNGCVRPGVKWSKEDEISEEELSCRNMINSMLIYGDSVEKDSYGYNKYLKPYTEKGTWHDGLFNEKRLAEIIAEQKKDFEKAIVKRNVYTDSEGCSYNSCVWADEVC